MLRGPRAPAHVGRCAGVVPVTAGSSVGVQCLFGAAQRQVQPVGLIRRGSSQGAGWVVGICFLF